MSIEYYSDQYSIVSAAISSPEHHCYLTLCVRFDCASDVTWLCILLLIVANGELVELRLFVPPGAVLMMILVALEDALLPNTTVSADQYQRKVQLLDLLEY